MSCDADDSVNANKLVAFHRAIDLFGEQVVVNLRGATTGAGRSAVSNCQFCFVSEMDVCSMDVTLVMVFKPFATIHVPHSRS